jgi:hypothetical protein
MAALVDVSLAVVDERVLATVVRAAPACGCGKRMSVAHHCSAPVAQAPAGDAGSAAAAQPTPERASAPPPPDAGEPATPAATALPRGAAAALDAASDVATSLRAERAALLAQLQSSESRRVP